jgi:hypothetical protein
MANVAQSARGQGPQQIRGKHIPNLVLVWDSEQGKDPEFRVQLEITLDPATAKAVEAKLWGDTPRDKDMVRAAKKMVQDKVPGLSSVVFRQIIEEAFEDQIETGGGQTPTPRP